MKTYRVGVILSTIIEVEAENEEEAQDKAVDITDSEYPELNYEECNFVEED